MHHHFLTLINGGGPLCTLQRLKPVCDTLLSSVAFKLNLRRYASGGATPRSPRVPSAARGAGAHTRSDFSST